MLRLGLLSLCTAILAACASSQPFQLDSVQSLTSPDVSGVNIKGLEFLADTIPGRVKPRVNVIYLHGIGWTEDPDIDALGQEFLDGIAESYGIEGQADANGKCLRSGDGPLQPNNDLLYVNAPEPIRYETAIPGTYLKLNRLACLDKHELAISDTLDVVVYRIFWDDTFWNAIQFAHVGQDDNRGSSQVIAGLRRKFNRQLKDEIVNYGFSDAVMYLGPVGQTIRESVRGAICAAELDAGGYGFQQQGLDTDYNQACGLAQNTTIETNQFAFVSESLGSKIIYDLLRGALTDGRDGPLDSLVQGTEVYMMANQLPLLSLSDVTTEQRRTAPRVDTSERPKVVALSEVNDFLTYEIVPFLEQMWKRSDHQDTRGFEDPALREEIARRLGFDFVDLRVQFADPILPISGDFVDPLQAHKEHAGEPELMRIILCGLEAGELREAGCLAADQDES